MELGHGDAGHAGSVAHGHVPHASGPMVDGTGAECVQEGGNGDGGGTEEGFAECGRTGHGAGGSEPESL